MSEDKAVESVGVAKEGKSRKVNHMTPDQAKAAMARCEKAGDTLSLYYRHLKEQSEQKP